MHRNPKIIILEHQRNRKRKKHIPRAVKIITAQYSYLHTLLQMYAERIAQRCPEVAERMLDDIEAIDKMRA